MIVPNRAIWPPLHSLTQLGQETRFPLLNCLVLPQFGCVHPKQKKKMKIFQHLKFCNQNKHCLHIDLKWSLVQCTCMIQCNAHGVLWWLSSFNLHHQLPTIKLVQIHPCPIVSNAKYMAVSTTCSDLAFQIYIYEQVWWTNSAQIALNDRVKSGGTITRLHMWPSKWLPNHRLALTLKEPGFLDPFHSRGWILPP